jgi:hypothetical protein
VSERYVFVFRTKIIANILSAGNASFSCHHQNHPYSGNDLPKRTEEHVRIMLVAVSEMLHPILFFQCRKLALRMHTSFGELSVINLVTYNLETYGGRSYGAVSKTLRRRPRRRCSGRCTSIARKSEPCRWLQRLTRLFCRLHGTVTLRLASRFACM